MPPFIFRGTFLNLDEEEFFKYLEIAKKTLSGTIGNQLLELSFRPLPKYRTEDCEFCKKMMQKRKNPVSFPGNLCYA